jgi:hypothetical protein
MFMANVFLSIQQPILPLQLLYNERDQLGLESSASSRS